MLGTLCVASKVIMGPSLGQVPIPHHTCLGM